MSDKHPYPEHVIAAVSDSLQREVYRQLNGQYGDFGGLNEEEAIETAHAALQALWDASRVDDVEAMKTLPNDAIVRSGIGGEPYTPYNFIHAPYEEDYPAHVIWWGDSDE